MRALKCEMCDSNDIVKDGEYFVCQSCGTKYTVEAAKKLMIEGTVNVQGNVSVQNAAKLENLLSLAHSSFDSQNFAQAEEFCNQVIAIDGLNYDAWKLKGEAINFQITAQNPRILEVFNCIMTSFKVLDDGGKQEHKEDILSSFKDCFEGEIHFWLEQFENERPTNTSLEKVKDSFFDSKSKIGQVFDELGFSESKDNYLSEFTNYFICEANKRCLSAWETTVGYNYYRDDFSNRGSRWNDGKILYITPNADEYRPTKQIWNTFVGETSLLIDLLEYAESLFDSKTSDTIQEKIFDNIICFCKEIIYSCSFKIAVGLKSGWSWDQVAGWVKEYSLNDSSKDFWQSKINAYERKKQELQRRKNEKYWVNHADRKRQLESEKDELKSKISKIKAKKKELGLFELKERITLYKQIIQAKNRINTIDNELTQNR